ncbi:hypothetical protein EGW08_016965 [Elysia chlorotica]|uniref:Uncharacterized protein n=1 Tax=Elysia chlorotica TaxID=188477 RepID=A0A3S0ZDP4_ELYCH|nr:hypothetical protein EGW08_016965 [Elysia chlorotica]
MAASSTVNIEITLLDGKKENISHSIAKENGDISFPGLLNSINFVQEKCNQLLTKIIEDEKSKRANLKLRPKDVPENENLIGDEKGEDDDDDDDNDEDEDDDDDDDDDDEITSTEPPEKKHKT